MESRRTLLRALAAGAAGLAGCSSDPPESETPTDTMTTATPTETTRTTEPTTTANDEGAPACDTQWSPDYEWTFERGVLRQPLATDDRLLVSSGSTVFSLSPADGSVQWRRSLDATVHAVADGAVILHDHATLTALELADGTTRWSVDAPTEHAIWSRTVQVHDGTLHAGASQMDTTESDYETEFGRIYTIDLESGEQSRLTDLQTEDGAVAVPEYVRADQTGIYATLEQGGVFGIDLDGSVRWRRYGDTWYYDPARAGDLLVQPWSRGVVALDVESGETVWSDDRIEKQATVADGVLYGTAGGSPQSYGTFTALDAATGEASWANRLDGCGGNLAVGAGVVATTIACRKSRLEVRDAASGCRLGRIEATTDHRTGLDVHDGVLYASLQGSDADQLVAVPLP
jgi:hypothetical protein